MGYRIEPLCGKTTKSSEEPKISPKRVVFSICFDQQSYFADRLNLIWFRVQLGLFYRQKIPV